MVGKAEAAMEASPANHADPRLKGKPPQPPPVAMPAALAVMSDVRGDPVRGAKALPTSLAHVDWASCQGSWGHRPWEQGTLRNNDLLSLKQPALEEGDDLPPMMGMTLPHPFPIPRVLSWRWQGRKLIGHKLRHALGGLKKRLLPF